MGRRSIVLRVEVSSSYRIVDNTVCVITEKVNVQIWEWIKTFIKKWEFSMGRDVGKIRFHSNVYPSNLNNINHKTPTSVVIPIC